MKTKRAFTLVEMLIVIVIIGLLAVVLIPKILGAQERARDTRRIADTRQIGMGLQSYIYNENSLPTVAGSGTHTIEDIADKLSPYLKSIPTDKNNGLVVDHNGDCVTSGSSYGYYFNTTQQKAIVTAAMEGSRGNTSNCKGITSSSKTFDKHSDGYNIDISDNNSLPPAQSCGPNGNANDCTRTSLADIVPDASFRAAIASAVGKTESQITQSDLNLITTLDAQNTTPKISDMGGIGYLTNLQYLQLNNNQITAIPDSLASLTNLIQLQLYSNQITTIPDAIGNLSNLTQLHLSSNQITTIPDAIGNLSNLQYLYLHVNKITTISDSIGNLSNLKRLYVNNNQITTIPDSFANFSNLTHLYFYGNTNLLSLPTRSTSINLTQLYLQNTKITCTAASTAGWNANDCVTGTP